MRALLLLVVTLGAAAGAAAQQTELKAWLAPGCHSYPVELAAGQQRFQLLTAADAESVKTSGVWAKCLSHSADGACTQPADGSETACNLAIESGARTGLEGQLTTTSAGEAGFVYVMNPESYPVLVDILVVVQPNSAAAAAEATAVGSYRRALLSHAFRASGAHKALHSGATAKASLWLPRRQLKQTDTTTIVPADGGNSGNSGSTPTPSGSSPTPTPSPSSSNEASNYIDRIANKFDDPTVRKWVKIAIIILIVLICLSILSCLFCILRCICWPCCCAARGFK